jgi:hypothetical protein
VATGHQHALLEADVESLRHVVAGLLQDSHLGEPHDSWSRTLASFGPDDRNRAVEAVTLQDVEQAAVERCADTPTAVAAPDIRGTELGSSNGTRPTVYGRRRATVRAHPQACERAPLYGSLFVSHKQRLNVHLIRSVNS